MRPRIDTRGLPKPAMEIQLLVAMNRERERERERYNTTTTERKSRQTDFIRFALWRVRRPILFPGLLLSTPFIFQQARVAEMVVLLAYPFRLKVGEEWWLEKQEYGKEGSVSGGGEGRRIEREVRSSAVIVSAQSYLESCPSLRRNSVSRPVKAPDIIFDISSERDGSRRPREKACPRRVSV